MPKVHRRWPSPRKRPAVYIVAPNGDWLAVSCADYEYRKQSKVLARLLSSKQVRLSASPGTGEAEAIWLRELLDPTVDAAPRPPQPKLTSEVAEATMKQDGTLHGGDNNSGEVEHKAKSQSMAKKDPVDRRNTSYMTLARVYDKTGAQKMALIRAKLHLPKALNRTRIHGNGGGSCTWSIPPDIPLTPEQEQDCLEASRYLLKCIGKGKPVEDVKIDYIGLVLAAQRGEDIRRYLEVDAEAHQSVRVLLTPDVSGSCAVNRAITMALAKGISRPGLIAADCQPNANGKLLSKDIELNDFDVVIYIGDGQGYWAVREHAKRGLFAIGFSDESHVSRGTLKVVESGKKLAIIDGVAPTSSSMKEACKLAADIIGRG